MSNYSLFIFDLDGTLIDSLEDLKHSVNYAFSQMNLPERSTDEVRTAIGNGALRLIEELLPEGEEQRKNEAFELFLPHYNKHCSEKTTIYNGVREFLDQLTNRDDITVALLTNKPEEPTRIILDRLDLAKHFELVIGGDTLPERKPSAAGINHAMEKFQKSKAETIMIGDSLPDIAAAKNAGVTSVGISEGFGEREFTPDITINSFKEINTLNLLA